MADELKGKIRVVRARFEDFKKRLSTFPKLDQSLKDSEIFLNLQITDLSEEFQKIKVLNEQILSNGDESIPEYLSYIETRVFDAIQNIYFKHSTILYEYLKVVAKSDRHDVTFTETTQATFSRINYNPNLGQAQGQVDLNFSYVNGSVPTFDGNYEKWTDFMDTFLSTVHENGSLSDGSKLKILQSLLKGDALKVIKREFGTLRSNDYESIWLKLTQRYNHKKSIVYAYFQTLFFQPSYEKETASNLKSLYDTSYDSVQALLNLGLKTNSWGDLLLFLVYSKLPLKTKQVWDEKQTEPDTLPDWKKFLEFLEHRFRTLEGLESSSKCSNGFNSKPAVVKRVSTFQSTSSSSNNRSHTGNSSKNICKLCVKGPHALRKCFKFKRLKVQERIKTVRSLGYCENCLSYSHELSNCESEFRCEYCKEKHNTLLCLNKPNNNTTMSGKVNSISQIEETNKDIQSTSDGRFSKMVPPLTFTSLVESEPQNECTIFPTALVKVQIPNGKYTVLRAMIDNCSDASYITEQAIRMLDIPVQSTNVTVAGLGNNQTAKAIGLATFEIQSLTNSNFIKSISAFVLPSISPNRPSRNFTVHGDPLRITKLADPCYNKKASIDLLLGGSIDALINQGGFFKLDDQNIILRETELGWVVSGSVPELNCFTSTVENTDNDNTDGIELIMKSLDYSIKRFWEVEELPNQRQLTNEEKLCEHIYNATTVRTSSGKYSVSLPFKTKVSGFSNMRNLAMSRFSQLERKFFRDPNLAAQYKNCMAEYIDLKHMSRIDPFKYPNGYYIPHHCVLKTSSSTTKLRVVFDASAKDSELQSLNDTLLNGPRLQYELLDHLVRFRCFKIAFTADIEKMYRQIEINPNDRNFQLILWRFDPSEEIKTYCLNTVTFGTKSAPYLAVKTLMRLAEDEKHKFPRGSTCLKEGFYVDDCIYGSDTIQDAMEIQSQIINILKSSGFHIRKWSANSLEVLKKIPESDRETDIVRNFDSKASVKTLGVQWCPVEDCFQYNITFDFHDVITKRSILSSVAQIFDPLGWLSPCLISAKLLIQQLWAQNINWDQPLSQHFCGIWKSLREGLIDVTKNLRVPRWLCSYTDSRVEIHGFSDSSTKAYAIAIYLKTVVNNETHINLLCAKTKVAPLKTISLPRLELMAALMLAKMMNHLKTVLPFSNTKYFYWSDSQITLAWINEEPHKRSVFVANRIAEIHSLSSPDSWFYVETKSNPSDLGTRGILPGSLLSMSLWWGGPTFLKTFTDVSPFVSEDEISLPVEDNIKSRQKKAASESIINTFLSTKSTKLHELTSNIARFSLDALNKFSTLSKLVRVVAYCRRFRYRSDRIFISPDEYEKALLVILRMTQEEVFTDELHDIQSDGVSKDSSIYSLKPFQNENDKLLRVTGRLENADHINYDQKHPVILPYSHIVSKLIVRHAHLATLHGTEQQTVMLIIQRYHILKCKSLVKFIINKCVKCFRQRSLTQSQLMGQLPKYRITPNRPFLNSGVDFAGPFDIKKFKGRCQSSYKSYFAIFVCFSTKAVHLEVVIDLSSSAFVAAYRRFISRRGICKNLHSDCGSNFIGAKGAVTRTKSQVDRQWHEVLAKELSEFHTNWHYNPPGAPHFGGLWEAGVKSVKHHLKRIIGPTRLTYDEFETVLIQVEACLNSRPLCEIRNASESIVLTPAHFLIQDNLLSLPDNNISCQNISYIDRWNLVQKIVQDFWKIWSYEYLNTLQQRKKWKEEIENLKVDDVVVIKEKHFPPNTWLMAKVLETYPGKDNLVRVVSLKTQNNILKRPIAKLCPLPIQIE